MIPGTARIFIICIYIMMLDAADSTTDDTDLEQLLLLSKLAIRGIRLTLSPETIRNLTLKSYGNFSRNIKEISNRYEYLNKRFPILNMGYFSSFGKQTREVFKL